LIKKTDAHFHINLCGFDIESTISYLDQNKFEKCWALTWEEINPPIPSLYDPLPIDDVLDAFRRYPDRIIPFYAPDPESKTAHDDMKRLISLGVKGCGELKVTQKWEDKIVEDYLKVISEFNLPLIFHMEAPRMQYIKAGNSKFEEIVEELLNGALNGVTKYYLKKILDKTSLFSNYIKKNTFYFPGYLYDFNFLEKRIQQFPNIIFIGHGPHFWNNIGAKLSPKYVHQKGKIDEFGIIDRLLETYENFYCDISGKSGFNALSRDPKQSRVFLEKHSTKILFGTDNTKYGHEELIDSFNLSDATLKKIYYLNSERIIS
jgi:predicted TIM-barrel fold metal-dependent hydrolase